MARIRSIHPGQWTDEAFVSVSFAARLLAIGLRNEADDRGVFPWSPLNLKMRLFPADHVNISDLLAELEQVDIVQRFDVDGKSYGAIRNFLKWQSPKYPSLTHPLPENLLVYVCGSPNTDPLNSDNSGNVPTSRARGSGKSGQRERRGEERRGEEKSTSSANAEDASPPSPAETPPPADEQPRRPTEPPVPVKEAVELWNTICGPLLGRVQSITDGRRTALRSRMVEHWRPDYLAGWEGYCRRVLRSNFLCGRTGGPRRFKADFDWLVKAANAVKVLEGRYDNERDAPPPDEIPVSPGTA